MKTKFAPYQILIITLILITHMSCNKNEKATSANKTLPVLTTNSIIGISDSTATSGGNITSDGGSAITARGICWTYLGNTPTTNDNKTMDGTGTGTFTSSLTGLFHGPTYFVRAYAINSLGTSYGNAQSFVAVGVPIVTSSAIFQHVSGNSAALGGSIINDGGSPVITQGICWSVNPNPTLADSHTTDFSSPLTNLSPNTVYYVKAYATNVQGTGFGNQVILNSGFLYGTSHAGGLVFYNDGYGHGMVSAQSDQSPGAIWGCSGLFFGKGNDTIGAGPSNTNGIVGWCTTPGIAARLCYDLVLNSYDDWFLPSHYELQIMDYNLNQLGFGGFTNAWYWSSSFPSGELYATAWDVGNNGVGYSSRNDSYRVRAARQF
jgi:hypothetical protein